MRFLLSNWEIVTQKDIIIDKKTPGFIWLKAKLGGSITLKMGKT